MIIVKDQDYELVKVKLDEANKLLTDICHGKSVLNEVKDFLTGKSRKRKVEVNAGEQILKKRKYDLDVKLLSFDNEESDIKVKKRKRKAESTEQIDLDLLLKKPSRDELEKEMTLNKLDDKIRNDREAFKKIEEKWEFEDKEFLNLKEKEKIEKKEALKIKKMLRSKLSDETLVKLTEANMEYLSNIFSGKVKSSKHTIYFDKCAKKTQSLLYTSVSDPFLDHQIDKVYYLVRSRFQSVPNMEENYLREAIILSFVCFLCFFF